MKTRIVLVICITLLVTGSLSADTKFSGAVSNSWSNANNWSNGLPDPDDKIQFDGGTLCILDYDAGVIKNTAMEGDNTTHLRLVDGALLSVSNWSIIGYGGTPEEPHLLEVLGGVYNSEIRMKIGFQGYGKLVVDYGGTVNMLDEEFDIAERAYSHGIVELHGGSLNLLTDSSEALRFSRDGNSTASMDFSGGILTLLYSDAQVANIKDHYADGTITAYGGIGNVVVDTGDANDFIHVRGLHPFNPVPEDGSIVTTPGTITLSWTVDEGTPVDVWFGPNPDLVAAELIVSNQAVTSVAVTILPKQRYFWAVDTYAPGAADPNLGLIFDFLSDNAPPVVKTAGYIAAWLENVSVEAAIAAAVTDVDPTTVAWTVISEPNEGTAVIANPDQTETTVTLSALGTYVLQLEADDGEYKGAHTLTIGVFSDNCEAAKSVPDWTAIPGDINLDCVVDQLDLDILNEQWLECTGLDCPGPNMP
jgi:hypothetical protein